MEVIFAIMEKENISIEEVEKVRIEKKKNRGGFKDKIYLIDVEEE